MAENPLCKKCQTPKIIMKGKKGQHFIGCPNCNASQAASPAPGPEKTTPAPAKPEQKKTKNFWW